MSAIAHIQDKLTQALEADTVEIIDNTYQHKGHPGSNGGAHLHITIVASKFNGMPILDRHRLVQSVLADELAANHIHALELKVLTPPVPAAQ
jgi:BolA protein